MSGLWPRVPKTVLRREVPRRFRRFSARFADPDRLLVQFIDWLESGEDALEPGPDASTAPHVGRVANGAAERDRRRLIEACIDVSERVPQAALAARLTRAVEEAGVVSLDGAGQRFDPERHHAVGQVPTSDPVLDYHVADTERPGYRDGATILRRPEVLVYVYHKERHA